MAANDNHDDEERKDLTRLEDISEFLHQEDPELESKLKNLNSPTEIDQLPDLPNEDDIFSSENSQPNEVSAVEEELTNENSVNLEAVTSPDDVLNENSFENSELTEEGVTNSFFENEESSDFNSQSEEFSPEEIIDYTIDEATDPPSEIDQESSFSKDSSSFDFSDDRNAPEDQYTHPSIEISKPEKFEEVKTFAQSFSYGQVSSGGNPPYSVIVRHIKYQEDALEILNILKEFSIVNEKNLEESKYALELGSLLIPQISEYAAVVVAHKLRRFDCDIEVGLSEEIHPPKGNESLPRGLSKKDTLKQNISDHFKKNTNEVQIEDILLSTTNHLENYEIEKYIGVQTTTTFVEEEELERLLFIQKSNRANTTTYDLVADIDDNLSTKQIFEEYKNSFDLLFVDLIDQLKQKAVKEKANALLGITFQIVNLPFKKSDITISGYQLICSATFAMVTQK